LTDEAKARDNGRLTDEGQGMTHAVVLLLVAAAPVPAAKPLNGQWWPHRWQWRVAIFSMEGQP
jgi:hypothetical protein